MSFDSFLLTFVPLFVAMDPIALVPLYVSVCVGKEPAAQRRILASAVITAFIVGIIFLFVGKGILRLIGVTVEDFQVAGGLLLLVISIKEILGETSAAAPRSVQIGAVPLGVPMIVGPAVVTSLIMLSDQYGYLPCLTSFCGNLAIVAILFVQSERLMRRLGEAVIGAAGKVAALLLAAYAVMMVRHGILTIMAR